MSAVSTIPAGSASSSSSSSGSSSSAPRSTYVSTAPLALKSVDKLSWIKLCEKQTQHLANLSLIEHSVLKVINKLQNLVKERLDQAEDEAQRNILQQLLETLPTSVSKAKLKHQLLQKHYQQQNHQQPTTTLSSSPSSTSSLSTSSSSAPALISRYHTTILASTIRSDWDLECVQRRALRSLWELERRFTRIERALILIAGGKTGTEEGTEEDREVEREEEEELLANLNYNSNPYAIVPRREKKMKVPAHFGNTEIFRRLKDHILASSPLHFKAQNTSSSTSSGSDSSSSSSSTAFYPLTKLLVVTISKDLDRIITSFASSLAIQPPTLESRKSMFHSLILSFSNRNLSPSQLDHLLTELPLLFDEFVNSDSTTRHLIEKEMYRPGQDNAMRSEQVKESRQQFAEKQERSWWSEKKNPFEDFKFTQPPELLANAERWPCDICGKSSFLYCPIDQRLCLPPAFAFRFTTSSNLFSSSSHSTPHHLSSASSSFSSSSPSLRLPVDFDIIHHPGENVFKSTSIHACVLCPSQCRFIEHPHEIPKYDPQTTVLLYPTRDAFQIDTQDNDEEDPNLSTKVDSASSNFSALLPLFQLDFSRINRVVVIESTWQKGESVAVHPYLASLPKIRLRERESTYWRYQELGRNYLSTLEAIYWVSREFVNRRIRLKAREEEKSERDVASYGGEFDDLMYIYAFQHSRIRERYGEADRGGKRPPKSWQPRQ